MASRLMLSKLSNSTTFGLVMAMCLLAATTHLSLAQTGSEPPCREGCPPPPCEPGGEPCPRGAGTVRPYEEYDKRLRSAQMVTPLASEVFGENVSLYNGATQFSVVDIDLPGNNALPVQLRRTFRVEPKKGDEPLGGFGAWDIDVPYLSGVFDGEYKWYIGSAGAGTAGQRCTTPWSPASRPFLDQNEIWSGTHLHIPGEGDREMLYIGSSAKHPLPTDGATYPWGTRDHFRLRCLNNTSNGYPGQGFVAVDSAGTKYFFDVGIERGQGAVVRGANVYSRMRVYLMASQVVDRHGNSVTYTYSGGRLTQISASDGRTITLSYTGDLITSASAHGRTWTYEYRVATLGFPGKRPLERVYLPDNVTPGSGSVWLYEYSGALQPYYYNEDNPSTAGCPRPIANETSTQFTMAVTHPAGVKGTFEFDYIKHYRSGVPENACSADIDGLYHLSIADSFDVMTLNRKTLGQVGVPAMIWEYDYGIVDYPRVASLTPCLTCPQSKTVTVTYQPGQLDSVSQQYEFGVLFGLNDGRLLKTSSRSNTGAVLRSETHTYVSEAEAPTMPFANTYGSIFASDDLSTIRIRPVKQTTINQQGANFTWQVNGPAAGFNSFAQPIDVTRSSTLGYSRHEKMGYNNNLGKWVIGQVTWVQDQATLKYIEQTTYSLTSALPTRRYAFGWPIERRTYNLDGTVAEIFDSSDVKKTILSNYHRGVPRSVVYHDGTVALASESAVVSDWGEITSITDAVGYTTSYQYDDMGRLELIDYPAGDTVNWNDTTIAFEKVNSIEYGLPANHWRQTISTGNSRKITYFDGLWRPVLSRTFDSANEANTRSSVQRRFDYANRETFVSYPQRPVINYNTPVSGISTSYDALGRTLNMQASSELGTLTTSWNYPSTQFRTQITDPRGYTITTDFQAFDQPNTDAPTLIQYPGSITTTIARDAFGKATSITRSGTYAGSPVSAMRRYVYDANERLCKTYDPEAGWAVTDYDASNNVAWTASGLSLTSLTDCQRTSVAAGDKSTRGYDGRNRLKLIDHPAGTPDTNYTYYADGALWTTTDNNATTTTGDDITWTYAYNKRRLLTGETLAVNALTLPVSHGYNANGHRSQLTYPDSTVVTYAPNALGEPTQVGTYATGISYHANGSVAGFTYGNGTVHSQTLNTRQLPLRRRDVRSGVDHLDLSYTYDQNGNLLTITDATTGAPDTRTLVYDALNRMTQANVTKFSQSYAYDPLDNLRQAVFGGTLTFNYSYSAANNRLTQLLMQDPTGSITHSYGYDARGNMTSRTNGHTHSYDRANRMLWATTPAGTETYRYDGHGRRTSIVRPGGTTTQLYSRDGTFLYERAPNGVVTKHIHLGGRQIARQVSSTRTYTHTDTLGSILRRTDTAGAEIERTRYEPYGSTNTAVYLQGPGFTGHVTDAATTLSYMQQRYYDNVAMRFVSVDPVAPSTGDGSNFNRYWYANANPYKYVDPDGREGAQKLGCAGTHISGVCERGAAGLALTAHTASTFTRSQVEFIKVDDTATQEQTGNTVVRDANRVVGMANRSGNREVINALNSVNKLIVDGRSAAEATGNPNAVAYTSFGSGYIGFILVKYFSLHDYHRIHKFAHEVFHQTESMEGRRQANPLCGWGCNGGHEHATEGATLEFMRKWWDPSEGN